MSDELILAFVLFPYGKVRQSRKLFIQFVLIILYLCGCQGTTSMNFWNFHRPCLAVESRVFVQNQSKLPHF